MDKNKFDLHKMRENFSGFEKFAHKYMIETLTAVAIVVGAFSAWTHLFIGTLGWSMLFLVIGSALGVFMSSQMDRILKKVYSFSRGESRTSVIVAEVIKIAVALFLPFIYFGFFGIMAGTAYQYYGHVSQSGQKGKKAA
jgi:hypothetical protein